MNTEIENIFNNYPEIVKSKLIKLRELIYTVAQEQNLGAVEESLKWGEPSYNTINGSPIRVGFKGSSCYLFFHCQSKLVSTFRELYSHTLTFEGNRAIVLNSEKPLPEHPVKECIKLALTYHKVKRLPLLGASL
ncbi:hypothetical protein PL71_07440 [Pseudoalteromonas distincta]|jgi:hypothetical protein|uniref:DUF1801 domain-containing protein n=1 Tax=Pseudoalteromonas distincta TaxID=77608 RepID=A0ABT9GJ56_9GAMM|nr:MULTISPECIES: DUF1801 domain-containing protein [Pseudoalteromonas distincta group]EGI73752.1 hypothetical protein PH505_an00320 [Pseudoalteromonas distincta]KHM49660.1 hypothetical protein PL71_07440 [Pseudoalteromonas elyakovii]KID32702.1 hypothetical protein QT16_20175 [Pseudoalteromonas distincta]MDP4485930.1 DUF1801 domain-containing protein [Pseudoalteromonas elyakovii]